MDSKFKMQSALTNAFVLAAAFLASGPGASEVGCAELPVQGLNAHICKLDEEDAFGLDDGASLLQLSESMAQHASTRGASTPSKVRDTMAPASSSRGKSVLATKLARVGKAELWLEVTRRRRETVEAVFGKTLTDRSRNNAKLVTAIVVAIAVLFGIAMLVYFLQYEDQEDSHDTKFAPWPDLKRNSLQQVQQATRHETAQFGGRKFGAPLPAQSGGVRSSPEQPTTPPHRSPPRPTAGVTSTGSPLVAANPRSPMPVLCPQLAGVVPGQSKFQIKIPPLLHVDRSQSTRRFSVIAEGSSEQMLGLTLTRHTPHDEDTIEELFAVTLPDADESELAICSFGRPRGPDLQCELYRTIELYDHHDDDHDDHELFGIVSSESSSQANIKNFTLVSISGRRLLTVIVEGDVQNRVIKVANCATTEILAVTMKGDDNYYKVECYAQADVTLVAITLMIVDRLCAAAAHGGHLADT